MVGVAFEWCFHNTASSVVERRDGSDDDGGAVPTACAAPDPDDSEPVLAADPAAVAFSSFSLFLFLYAPSPRHPRPPLHETTQNLALFFSPAPFSPAACWPPGLAQNDPGEARTHNLGDPRPRHENEAGEGKKHEILGRPPFGPPPFEPPTFSGSGPRSSDPTLRAPTLLAPTLFGPQRPGRPRRPRRVETQTRTILVHPRDSSEKKKATGTHPKLKGMVTRYLEQKIRVKHVTSRDRLIDNPNPFAREKEKVDRREGNCNQWVAKGQCSDDKLAVSNMIQQKEEWQSRPSPSPRRTSIDAGKRTGKSPYRISRHTTLFQVSKQEKV